MNGAAFFIYQSLGGFFHGLYIVVVFIIWQERDATDVMAAFHSDEAFDRLKTLPVVRGKEAVEPNAVTKKFRAFRKELVSAKK